VTLTDNLGSSSLTIAQLFSSGAGFSTITGSLQPIFDAGLLDQREVAARATSNRRARSSESTVVTAFQNVAASLSALRNDKVALQKAVAAENAAGGAHRQRSRRLR
jgi:outer membrane protein TolC